MTKQETIARIITYILEARKDGLISMHIKKNTSVYQGGGEGFFVSQNGIITDIYDLSNNQLTKLLNQIIDWTK